MTGRMTAQEAIEIIERVDICANAAETARYMAIRALKKQTPQKPIRANRIITEGNAFYLDEDNEYWKCPVCTQYDVPLRENQKYCHYCGQAIGWRTDNA